MPEDDDIPFTNSCYINNSVFDDQQRYQQQAFAYLNTVFIIAVQVPVPGQSPHTDPQLATDLATSARNAQIYFSS